MSSSAAVVDCSALIRTLTDHGPTGHTVRHRLAGLTSLVAPGLLDYEMVSALFGMVRGRKLTARDAEKAIRELGWKPQFPKLDDIVATAWAWHVKHPNGYPD